MPLRQYNNHNPIGKGLVFPGRSSRRSRITARPFLKWVGGKGSILPELLQRMPATYSTYHEPFVGGGALFFAVRPKKAALSDVNGSLIRTFQAVRDNVEGVIKQYRVHSSRHNKEYYVKVRAKLSKEQDEIKLAALFIYLNKTCFNGLYRVNKSGEFNVPMGNYNNPAIIDTENLRKVSKLLQGVTIEQYSFEQTKITKKDFYYLDPPYHLSYNSYDRAGFGEKEQEQLARFCQEIDKQGGYFMLSNSDTPLVRELYNGYTIEIVSASRIVSGKVKGRGKVYELIIRNY